MKTFQLEAKHLQVGDQFLCGQVLTAKEITHYPGDNDRGPYVVINTVEDGIYIRDEDKKIAFVLEVQ